MRPTLMWAAIWLMVIMGVSGDSIKENAAVSSGLVAMSCSIETLKQNSLVERCFNSNDDVIHHLELKFVPAGTICTIKCRKNEGISYRLCDSQGYWTGPQLKCTEVETSGQELECEKRGWSRSIRRAVRRVGRVVRRVGRVVRRVGRVVRRVSYRIIRVIRWRRALRVRARLPRIRVRRRGWRRVVCGVFGCKTTDSYPKIQCPPSTSIAANEGRCDAVVTWQEATANDDKGIKSIHQIQPAKTSGDRFKSGTTTVVYVATDTSGKTARCSFHFTVKEDNPPSIKCPPETSFTANEGQCDAVVTWKKATATDDKGIKSVHQTHPAKTSGDRFKPGTTSVVYVATDTRGQTASCSFDFKVNVNCAPGTSSNGTDCVPCLQGEYQDEEGQTECKPCPNGKTTSFSGAANLTDCDDSGTTDSKNSGHTDRIVAGAAAADICLVVVGALIVIKTNSASKAALAIKKGSSIVHPEESKKHGDSEQNSPDESRPATSSGINMSVTE